MFDHDASRALRLDQVPDMTDASEREALRRDHYAVLSEPLLSDAACHELREAFGRIVGWGDRGWYNAFNDPDLTTRRQAEGAILDAIAPALTREFGGFEPFLVTYLTKWSGDDRDANFTYLHRDWMYVDERTDERTFVVFVALEPIDDTNGQVWILPGSALLDDDLRGSDMSAPWLTDDDTLRPRLRPVPLATGQAVVWDAAIAHGTGQNLAPRPRVALGIWLRRRGTQLVHFRRRDNEWAERHEITPEFFAEMTPPTIDAALAACDPAEIVAVGASAVDGQQLRHALDGIEQRRRAAPPSS